MWVWQAQDARMRQKNVSSADATHTFHSGVKGAFEDPSRDGEGDCHTEGTCWVRLRRNWLSEQGQTPAALKVSQLSGSVTDTLLSLSELSFFFSKTSVLDSHRAVVRTKSVMRTVPVTG